MLSALRNRLSSIRGDAGITLTELLVTMGLLTIVGALALTALLGTASSSDRTTETSLTTASARTVLSAWTNLLQVAVVPDPSTPSARGLSITTNSITFNAQLNNLPDCSDTCTTGATSVANLSLQTAADGSTQLVQTLTSASGTKRQILVSSGAAAPATGCVFHPYGYDGTDLGCSALPADKTSSVGRIDISFSVTPRSGPAQSFTSSAKLPGATS